MVVHFISHRLDCTPNSSRPRNGCALPSGHRARHAHACLHRTGLSRLRASCRASDRKTKSANRARLLHWQCARLARLARASKHLQPSTAEYALSPRAPSDCPTFSFERPLVRVGGLCLRAWSRDTCCFRCARLPQGIPQVQAHR